MPLTKQQKDALANELVDVMEKFMRTEGETCERYEALIEQPKADHLVITLQPTATPQ